jgi:hypothetical protein
MTTSAPHTSHQTPEINIPGMSAIEKAVLTNVIRRIQVNELSVSRKIMIDEG